MTGGSCDCGLVAYRVDGPLRAVHACHCRKCRKTSGHFWAATAVADTDFEITRSDGLKWYRSSDFAQRGFCTGCGASLFYKQDGSPTTAIGAGTLDGETGLELARHIFVKDKGDYYEIACKAQQLEGWKE